MSFGRIKFIVEADEPALFFESQDQAETSLESVDIEDGIYPIAFDAEGAVYDVVPDGKQASLVRRADAQADPERLKNTLRRFLRATHTAFSEEDSLEHLLARCEPYLSSPRTWPGRKE